MSEGTFPESYRPWNIFLDGEGFGVLRFYGDSPSQRSRRMIDLNPSNGVPIRRWIVRQSIGLLFDGSLRAMSRKLLISIGREHHEESL